MNKRRLSWLIVFTLMVFIFGVPLQDASAKLQNGRQLAVKGQAAATQVPTIPSPSPVTEDITTRVLPSVGGNAGLVIGASLLVLIIIGGVMLSSRRKQKH